MFMGHYGPAYFESRSEGAIGGVKLWQGFIAVQFIDIVFMGLLLMGLEGPREAAGAVPEFHIPYSHSLLSALILSAIAGAAGYIAIGRTRRVFWIIFSLTLSHWVLDWLVHIPDLPLYPGGRDYGLGLWQFPRFAYGLEMGLVLAGTLFWTRKSRAKSPIYTALPWVLFGIMAAFQYVFIFMPPVDPAPLQTAIMGLVTYAVLAGLIAWTEAGRPWTVRA